MSIKEKLLIIFLSIVISFVGFNLIASSYAGLLNEAYEACYETMKSNLAECEVNSHQIPNHDEKGLKFTRPGQDHSNSK
jgi:hypothetical protein